MAIDLMPGFGAFTQGGLLDGSEADGSQLFTGNAAMTTGWTTDQATFTASVATAPNGATDAGSLIESTNTTRHIIYQQVTGLSDVLYRYSVYAKETGRRYLVVFVASDNGTAGVAYSYFDLQTGTATDTGLTGGTQTATNATIAAAVGGFYKCSFDFRMSATTTAVYAQFNLSDVGTYGAPLSSDCPEYDGDAVSGVYLWRPKLVTA
jgi:hypothetical protein